MIGSWGILGASGLDEHEQNLNFSNNRTEVKHLERSEELELFPVPKSPTCERNNQPHSSTLTWEHKNALLDES